MLAIATKYDMETIRWKAIQEVHRANPPLDPVDQIVAARRYDCTALADAPMEVLVKRVQPLSIEEMVKLPKVDLEKWIMERDKSPRGKMCKHCGTQFDYCPPCGRYS